MRERELKPLRKIQNNYEKLVITLSKALDDDYDGIRVENIVDWLLKQRCLFVSQLVVMGIH